MTGGGSFDRSNDDELLAALGRALQAQEVVPDAVLEAAKGAYAWRTIDAELAALTFDSVADADALGRFQVPDLVAGPFRLLCRFRTGARWPAMLTEWVVI